MSALFADPGLLWQGFSTTLWIAVAAGVLSFIWGVLLAGFRVSPVAPLRAFATSYVTIVRNSPLTLMFLFFGNAASALLGFPIPLGTFTAVLALTLYTATFVAEALRSGINSVSVGQAEAARSLGFTFFQTLRLIVLPQAFRSVLPPMINVYIAHIKNTSVAAGFASVEMVAFANRTANQNPGDVVAIFAGIGLLYLLITIPLSVTAESLEKRVAVAR